MFENRIVKLGSRGPRTAGGVHFDDAVAGGVLDGVGEDGGAGGLRGSAGEHLQEALAVEDVVAEDEGDGIVADEFAADDEGLGETFGLGLDRVLEVEAEVFTVAEEALEAPDVVGCGDDEDVAQAGEHEGGEGIVDHRLVVDGEHLLADSEGHGVQAGSGPSGEDDPLGEIGIGGWG